MANRRTAGRVPDPTPSRLKKSREEASIRLADRITAGNALLARRVNTREEYDDLCRDEKRWHETNRRLLESLFNGGQLLREYEDQQHSPYDGAFDETIPQFIKTEKKIIQRLITKLEAIRDGLQYMEEPQPAQVTFPRPDILPQKDVPKVFLVHGRDVPAAHSVARVLDKIGLNPIILKEQAHAGRTIIQKFQEHADVHFAVILLTADDVGGLREDYESDSKSLKSRARQNVILELGYFLGLFRGKNFCLLLEKDVELPSDLDGLGWHRFDPNGTEWIARLGKELQAGQIQIDMQALMALL